PRWRPNRRKGDTAPPRRPRAAVLPQCLHHRPRQEAACRRTSLRRLRSTPWLPQQTHSSMDRARRDALRRAHHANRRAQDRGGAAGRNKFTLNSNTYINSRIERIIIMRTRDLYPSKFLQSADAKAKQIVATISSLEVELVGQGQDQKKKPVLHLEGQKPMVLNRTNCETLEDAFGDSNDWPGHKIKIYCVKNAVRGQDGRRA